MLTNFVGLGDPANILFSAIALLMKEMNWNRVGLLSHYSEFYDVVSHSKNRSILFSLPFSSVGSILSRHSQAERHPS